ncbi:MAG: carbohydrate ABC transporter permease [Clostridia bacterium]|nr:carbohydrate ABC transporter permease [Clostridia bacterium]
MKKISIGRILLHIFLILLSLTYILPLILMISISFSSESAIKEFGYTLMPKVFSLDAYKLCFRNPYQLLQSYKVTIAFAMLGTVLATLVQSLMAYPLSRRNFKLRGIITKYIFVTMLFSGGLVPAYILNTKYLHLGNSFWIYIFPGLMSAWNVIVFRTFFQGLPDGLVEAAKIDGAKEIMIFFRIILPLSTPVIASLGFMTLVGKWNDWNTSLLYIRDSKLYSLQYLLQRILREAEYVKNLQLSGEMTMLSDKDLPTETMRYAMAMLAAGPMLVVFPFFQKYFAKGMVVGAVKG